MWVCGRSPHTHIFHSFRLAGDFFNASILIIVQLAGRPRVSHKEISCDSHGMWIEISYHGYLIARTPTIT
jgi:hypothetical protein